MKMKAYLMFRDRDFDIDTPPAFGRELLNKDLELGILFNTMAQNDQVIMQAVQSSLFTGLATKSEIEYRQAILKDCIKNPDAVRKLYALTGETLEKQRKGWWWFSKNQYLSSLFPNAVNSLTMLSDMLRQTRDIADREITSFKSEGFVTLFSMLQRELDDAYLDEIKTHLNELKFRDGTLISARLGNYNQGIDYVLRKREKKGFWRRWRFAPSFTIAPRDDSGAADLGKRRDRAINEAANVLAQSAEHVVSFFNMLRNELAFYIGCLNLYDELQRIDTPVCFPVPVSENRRERTIIGLYDISLALNKNTPIVGSDLKMKDKSLYIITGANQGGKSTFLRSIGQSQLMMQCGMFVAAESFSSHITNGVFSHFKKEEDASLKSGKLDEELARMSNIADHLKAGSLMLFNESFSSTNEREGSEIGRQITNALLDSDIEVFSVSHLFDFSHSYYTRNLSYVAFLQAERRSDGYRTFRIIEGAPTQTGFGDDLYRKIFVEEESKDEK